MISLTIRLDRANLDRRLDDLRTKRIPAWRRELVETLARETLERTISRNPVDTARSRASWVEALAQLGGAVTGGWQGSRPVPDAIREGVDASRTGILESGSLTQVSATSFVHYVPFLEYGTRYGTEYHMVQRSLAEIAALVTTFAPPLFEPREN